MLKTFLNAVPLSSFTFQTFQLIGSQTISELLDGGEVIALSVGELVT